MKMDGERGRPKEIVRTLGLFGLDDNDDDGEDKKRTSDRFGEALDVILTNGVGVELRLTTAKNQANRMAMDGKQQR